MFDWKGFAETGDCGLTFRYQVGMKIPIEKFNRNQDPPGITFRMTKLIRIKLLWWLKRSVASHIVVDGSGHWPERSRRVLEEINQMKVDHRVTVGTTVRWALIRHRKLRTRLLFFPVVRMQCHEIFNVADSLHPEGCKWVLSGR